MPWCEGPCVPRVASGTAAVTASAGGVCWGEEIRLPGGEMALITCSQAFECHLVEEVHLKNNIFETTEV